MLSTKKLLYIFIPALLIVGFAFFVQIIQYQPLFPKVKNTEKTTSEFVIPLHPSDPIIGDVKSPITIVAFEDFSCPACIQQSAMLKNLNERYPSKFKIVWKGLPVSEFPYPSLEAQKYGYCANEQKRFADFQAGAFANSNTLSETILQTIVKDMALNEKNLSKCLNDPEVLSYIDNNKQIAQVLNIQSVPTFFIDNKQIKNPTSEYQWEDILGLNQ